MQRGSSAPCLACQHCPEPQGIFSSLLSAMWEEALAMLHRGGLRLPGPKGLAQGHRVSQRAVSRPPPLLQLYQKK